MSKKITSIITALVVIIAGVGIFYFLKSGPSSANFDSSVVSEDGDKQIISIKVKDGYKPGNILAKADKPTILRMTTDKTYDCSTLLVIPDLKKYETLPQTGVTDIEIPAQKPGTDLKLTCHMGTYNGLIRFS